MYSELPIRRELEVGVSTRDVVDRQEYEGSNGSQRCAFEGGNIAGSL